MPSVLITGTSKGIGFATALALGRAGYTVFAAMRNPTAHQNWPRPRPEKVCRFG